MRSAAKGVKPCNFASHSTNKTDCNKPRANNKVFNVVHTHMIADGLSWDISSKDRSCWWS